MIIKFHKYQGAGNDFIIIDNRLLSYCLSPSQIAYLCHRQFGIGADGLMLLENGPGYDFRMRYFNSDGQEASMCGNGGRCIIAFARLLGIISRDTCFLATDGPHQAIFTSAHTVKLKMRNVKDVRIEKDYFFLDTGSPHYVRIVEDPFQTDVFHEGRKIRYAETFMPAGTNVNFISLENDRIKVATYERGVENETLACGTGCVAAALTTAIVRNEEQNTYPIQTKGGKLSVSFFRHSGNSFSDIWLEGEAKHVFQGEIEIE